MAEELEDVQIEKLDTTEQTTEDTEISAEQQVDETKVPKKDSIKDDLLKERKKRQELERQVKEFESKYLEESFRSTKAELKQEYIDDGLSEEVAEKRAEREAKRDSQMQKFESMISGLSNPVVDEIRELAESDEFFNDAPSFKEDIAKKMKEHKGISAEEAYMMVRGKERAREVRQNLEVRTQFERKEIEQKGVPSSGSGKTKELYPLDEEDKKTLQTMQRLKPEDKWTAKRYWELKQR